jgi:hypothetical protein
MLVLDRQEYAESLCSPLHSHTLMGFWLRLRDRVQCCPWIIENMRKASVLPCTATHSWDFG